MTTLIGIMSSKKRIGHWKNTSEEEEEREM